MVVSCTNVSVKNFKVYQIKILLYMLDWHIKTAVKQEQIYFTVSCFLSIFLKFFTPFFISSPVNYLFPPSRYILNINILDICVETWVMCCHFKHFGQMFLAALNQRKIDYFKYINISRCPFVAKRLAIKCACRTNSNWIWLDKCAEILLRNQSKKVNAIFHTVLWEN